MSIFGNIKDFFEVEENVNLKNLSDQEIMKLAQNNLAQNNLTHNNFEIFSEVLERWEKDKNSLKKIKKIQEIMK